MSEPPRPPGSPGPGDHADDPTRYVPPSDPTAPPPPPPPTSGAGGYAPPPTSGPPGGYAPPPTSGPPGGYPPPTSGPPGAGPYPPQGGHPGYGAPGYGAPGAPGYGAPGAPGGPGYGAPGYGPGANEDKTWILVAHFGGAAGAFFGGGCAGWIAPLVALIARGNQSPVVRAHAVQALNFQILWSIIALVGWILTCIIIGAFVAIAAMIVGIVFGVIAGSKASNGEMYNYPMSVSFIK
ncbi:DUF4870 domain-containing protein [Spirilliplanes yamanashiensis]|nr:DUF4870 domain-containing protein [Spirilliplanes yamanashiensis]MDP9816505.1 putative Tic20 family protein [Spirilliplanes yamanashiensis]